MSNLLRHAEIELARLDMAEPMKQALLQVVRAFSDEGHSGGSAPNGIGFVTSILKRVLMFMPITPIEDIPEEWTEVSDGLLQNKRYSALFKDKKLFNGQAYNVEGKIFSDDMGKTWFTNHESKLPVKFPYYVPLCPFKYFIDKDGHVFKDVTDYKERGEP